MAMRLWLYLLWLLVLTMAVSTARILAGLHQPRGPLRARSHRAAPGIAVVGVGIAVVGMAMVGVGIARVGTGIVGVVMVGVAILTCANIAPHQDRALTLTLTRTEP